MVNGKRVRKKFICYFYMLAPSPRYMNQSLDKSTFELLFRNEFKGLVLFAIQYVKDYEAAREIVQEAFIGLWDKRDQIDLSRPVKSYLSTSVRNRSLNYLRDNKKFDTRLLSQENLYPLASYEQADRLVEKELQDQIHEAVSELPERCREVFLLSRNEHLKYQAIADKLQISVKTVETQMSKALQHLRSRLREYLVILLLVWLMPDAGYQIRDTGYAMRDHFTTSLPRCLATSLQGNPPVMCIING